MRRHISPADALHEEGIDYQCQFDADDLVCLQLIELIQKQKASPGVNTGLEIVLVAASLFGFLPVDQENVETALLEVYLIDDGYELGTYHQPEYDVEGIIQWVTSGDIG
jgi:hypothetical protein